MNVIEEEISLLEKELSIPHQRIGFCHNDLQYGNIMIDEENNSLTIIVSSSINFSNFIFLNFITMTMTIYQCVKSLILNLLPFQDYEYASYNPVAYDIANHFCEMVADYHTDTPHILDFSKYPGVLHAMKPFFDV